MTEAINGNVDIKHLFIHILKTLPVKTNKQKKNHDNEKVNEDLRKK